MAAFIYILTNKPHGTLYIGVTNDLVRRTYEHREEWAGGFTSRHHLHMLVFFEEHPTMPQAIQREKSLKRWKRAWKTTLIETANPHWRDLWPDVAG